MTDQVNHKMKAEDIYSKKGLKKMANWTDRDARIETYYESDSAWGMAERIVDLEDEVEGRKKQVDFLYALEACGVDNWEGYSTAWQLAEGEIIEDDI